MQAKIGNNKSTRLYRTLENINTSLIQLGENNKLKQKHKHDTSKYKEKNKVKVTCQNLQA